MPNEIPWCEIHHVQFELFQYQDSEEEYYDCPECKREDAEALYSDVHKPARSIPVPKNHGDNHAP